MSLGLLSKISAVGTKVLTKLPAPVSGAIGKVSLAATVNSPWLLAVGGGILAVGAVIEASRKTPKFMEDLEEYNAMLEEQKLYKERVESGEIIPKTPYTKRDYTYDRMSIYAKIVVSGIKRYGKAAVMLVGSFTCFGMALKILNGWFAGASAALAMTQDELAHLEENVEKEYGAEVLERLKGPNQNECVVESHIDENGDTVVDKVNEPNHTAFTYIFDESNPNWTKDPAKNKDFLKLCERWLNNILDAKGYVFLNDALEQLGFDIVDAGQVFGWVKNRKDPLSANKRISLGIFEDENQAASERIRAFIDGQERSVWLTFNVDPKPIVGKCGLRPY